MAVAFRCNNCGTLEPPEAAGERALPAACRNCNHGVSFDTVTGIKTFNDDNWTVLADLSNEEREALRVVDKDGTTYERWDKDLEIVAHEPWPSTVPEGREPANIEVSAEESLGAEDNV